MLLLIFKVADNFLQVIAVFSIVLYAGDLAVEAHQNGNLRCIIEKYLSSFLLRAKCKLWGNSVVCIVQ